MEEDAEYSFCRQRFDSWTYRSIPFPEIQPEGKEWMTDDQEDAVRLFGLTGVFVLFGYIFFVLGRGLKNFFMRWFVSVYEPSGQAQHIDFSSNDVSDTCIATPICKRIETLC